MDNIILAMSHDGVDTHKKGDGDTVHGVMLLIGLPGGLKKEKRWFEEERCLIVDKSSRFYVKD